MEASPGVAGQPPREGGLGTSGGEKSAGRALPEAACDAFGGLSSWYLYAPARKNLSMLYGALSSMSCCIVLCSFPDHV